MSRKKAREIVLCLVFEKDYHKDLSCKKLFDEVIENGQLNEIYNSVDEPFESFNAEDKKNIDKYNSRKKNITLTENDLEYIEKVFFGVFENIEQLDNLISESSIGWEYNRISKISMALLRMSVYEALYVDDVPVSVSINEAVELSKRYDHADAYTFINGVLGTIAKNIK